MAETSGVKTLNRVVDEFLLKTGRDKDNYFKYEQFAIDAMRDMRMLYLRGVVKWAKLTISALKTISFPSDYVSFVGVCVPINGQFWFLTEKQNLVITTTGATLDATAGEGVDITDEFLIGYPASGGVNSEGYYKIDERNRRIFINSCDSDTVVLLYNSSGVNTSGDTYIPVRAVDAIEAYILYKDAIYSADFNKSALYERNYFNAVDKLKYIESPTLYELRDALYEVISPLAQR